MTINSTCSVHATTFMLWMCVVVVLVDAGTRFLDWTVSLAPRSLLGTNKSVIVINDQFPGPLLDAMTDDVLNINVHNNLTEPFLITWNGIQMRRNSWQDGVQETNCPILPGQNWTYNFQVKDQIGSFFYFPSLLLQKAAGGYGPVRICNSDIVPPPFPKPRKEYHVLIGDWFDSDHRELRASLDQGRPMPQPKGILINGLGPNETSFEFEPGFTYWLRISNVGLKTSLNFRIEDHILQLVEIEGSYTVKENLSSLDVHVGQSYSLIVEAKNQTDRNTSYYMVASSRFSSFQLVGIGFIRYPNSQENPSGPILQGPSSFDYKFSMDQAQSIRWHLKAGAARVNPQGSYHYGRINVSRTLVLENGVTVAGETGKLRYMINGVSFVHPDMPLKLADHSQMNDEFKSGVIADRPSSTRSLQTLGTSVVDVRYRNFYHLVFQNPMSRLQTWHLDGHNFFVVGMDNGEWNETKRSTYNLIDAVSRSTVQVYPFSWTVILVMFDNQGMWNLRSQDAENWYLGQELYFRVKDIGEEDPSTIPVRDELPMPSNVIKCGRATST